MFALQPFIAPPPPPDDDPPLTFPPGLSMPEPAGLAMLLVGCAALAHRRRQSREA
jgi:hypothetical protein